MSTQTKWGVFVIGGGDIPKLQAIVDLEEQALVLLADRIRYLGQVGFIQKILVPYKEQQ